MATSGRIQSANFNGNTGRFYFQWQWVSNNIGGNYTTINWQWGINISGGGFWGSNSLRSNYGYINGGLAFGSNTFSNQSGSGDHQLLAGSWNIGHNNDGTKNFGMSSEGWSTGDGNFGNSGSWDLPSIPRAAKVSALSMDAGGITAYDEGPMWVEFNNPAGSAVQVFIDSLDGAGRVYTSGFVGSRHNIDFSGGPLTAALQNVIPNSNAGTIRIGIYDASFGQYDYYDRTYYIKNDAGQANPTFSTTAYHDSNSTTATLTGNDQYIIQNQSTLNLDIASGNKATSNKGSSMVSYTATINAVPTNITYTTSTINQSLGSVNASSDQILATTATDSRGNTKTVNKTVMMVPYAVPTISAVGNREDGFGEDTTINITANYSTITVGGVAKNSVNNANGIGYKVWAVGGSEPGSYTNVPSTYSGGNVTITSAPIETLDQDTEFNLKVKITDALNTTTYSTTISIGKAMVRFGSDGKLYSYNKEILPVLDIFPVGSIVYRTTNTNPQSVYGGTWTATSTASATILGELTYGFKRTA